MMITSSILLACLAAVSASPLQRALGTSSSSTPAVVNATYDSKCFYPKPTEDFVLEDYLGRWYQAAGTPFGPTIGCECVFADYSLNDNGTVKVQNGCARNGKNATIRVEGVASPLAPNAGYGDSGVLRVQFPGQPPSACPGPNYIVQDIGINAEGDDCQVSEDDPNAFAIVQSTNFTTLFLLSRNQTPSNASIEAWLERARKLGTNLDNVAITNQTGCQFP